MNATLPNGLASVDHSISGMDVGESGWTVPWAMFHDKQRNLWLNGAYTLHTHPGGTVKMLVRRDEAGWHVDASKCRDHQWSEAGYCGDFPPVAVATFST